LRSFDDTMLVTVTITESIAVTITESMTVVRADLGRKG
jgi:hypothetical protein